MKKKIFSSRFLSPQLTLPIILINFLLVKYLAFINPRRDGQQFAFKGFYNYYDPEQENTGQIQGGKAFRSRAYKWRQQVMPRNPS